LEKGVGVRGRELGSLLRDQETLMTRAFRSADLDGLPVTLQAIMAQAHGDHRINLQVVVA
jgi:hypothetical protein